MRIVVGSDHAGFDLKEKVREYLTGLGWEVEDVGTQSADSVDYPDFAWKVAARVRDGAAERGILMCGTGVGMCIAANKVDGVRAATVWNSEIARLSRLHNDANVLCLPGRTMDPAQARKVVKVWLETPFEGGRHGRRVEKISAIEAKAGKVTSR